MILEILVLLLIAAACNGIGTALPADGGIKEPPEIRIVSPLDGEILTSSFLIEATATSPEGLDRVHFFVDGIFKSAIHDPPFTVTVDTARLSSGFHILTATAYDSNELSAVAQTTVIVDRQEPSVSIRSPSAGGIYGRSIPVEVEAGDDNAVRQVSFSIDGQFMASVLEAPYLWTWDTAGVASDSYTISVTAEDIAGKNSSDSVRIIIDRPPSIVIVSPDPDDTVSRDVEIIATATDDNPDTRIIFKINGNPLDCTPFHYGTCIWDSRRPVQNRATIRVEAIDSRGQVSHDDLEVNVQWWAIDTVESVELTSRPQSLAIRSDGYPVLSYRVGSDTISYARYARLDSAGWNIHTFASLDIVGGPYLVLDVSDKAHLAYSQLDKSYYMVQNGAGWDTMGIPGLSNKISALTIRQPDTVLVAHMPVQSIRLASLNEGIWSELPVTTTGELSGAMTVLAEDSGILHLGYGSAEPAIQYAGSSDGDNWVVANVTSTGEGLNCGPMMAVVPPGKICLLYGVPAQEGYSLELSCNPSPLVQPQAWTKPLTLAMPSVDRCASLAIAESGRLHIAAIDVHERLVYYSVNFDGTSPILDIVAGGTALEETAADVQIALDREGKPHLTFFSPSKQAILYSDFH